MRVFLFIFCISLLLFNCKEDSNQTVMEISSEGVAVEVSYGAGDSYNVKDAIKPYLPLPFNIAQKRVDEQTHLDFIILSDRIYKGQNLNVIPIGAMRLSDDGVKKDFFIAIPNSANRQTFKASEFSDFAVEHASIKWMIEQYFTNYKGFAKVKLISWEDEQYALRKINAAQGQRPKG